MLTQDHMFRHHGVTLTPPFLQCGQNGKLGHSCTNVTKGKLYGSQDSDHVIVHLGLNVSSSAHNCGCVVDGGNAMAAI